MSTFPRATIHVQRKEWDDARANRSTMTRTYLESHLAPVADQVRLVDGEAEVLLHRALIEEHGARWEIEPLVGVDQCVEPVGQGKGGGQDEAWATVESPPLAPGVGSCHVDPLGAKGVDAVRPGEALQDVMWAPETGPL